MNLPSLTFIHDEHVPLIGADVKSDSFKLELSGGSAANADVDLLLFNIRYHTGNLPEQLPNNVYHITKGFESRSNMRGNGTRFFVRGSSLSYKGGKVVLSSTPDGKGNLNFADGILIAFSYPFTSIFQHDTYSTGCLFYETDVPPIDITSHFLPGLNSIDSVAFSFQLRNWCSGVKNISPIYLVVLDDTPPTPTPTPGPEPFLELPFNYESTGKSFEEIVFNPNSWFDHEYPLQNVNCCLLTALNFAGLNNNYYDSHAGYDYGVFAGLSSGKPVLAAASGFATFKSAANSGGLGNVIKIDHGNGYQSWYGHLQSDGLIVSNENAAPVFVNKGEPIGKVGNTGNSTHSHLHFAVVKDSNENDNFNDDYPYGLVDPLGWEAKTQDPWEIWEENGRTGTKSYNLFTKNTPSNPTPIPDFGGSVQYKNINVNIPADAYNGPITVKVKNGPYVKKENTKSAVPSFYLEAFDSQNQPITQFLAPLEITVDYSNFDLSNTNINSLVIYYYNESTGQWEALPTSVSVSLKTATASTNHFSHFSLMGEIKDLIPPTTTVTLGGDHGQQGWFRSTVSAQLNSIDNENGVGVAETAYSYDKDAWNTYADPILFSSEGAHTIFYTSNDLADNEEGIKTTEFNIDKTKPEITVDTSDSILWPPNNKSVPIKIEGSANDQNLAKVEVTVTDEYKEFQPIKTTFGSTVNLKASRKGNDKDGRVYTITAKATDKAGNTSTAETKVIVPNNESRLKELLLALLFRLIRGIN